MLVRIMKFVSTGSRILVESFWLFRDYMMQLWCVNDTWSRLRRQIIFATLVPLLLQWFLGQTEMYSTCSTITQAIHLFNKRKDGDDRLWSAMIPGYAHYGNTDRENETFDKMQRAKVTLNEVTFLGLLSAFSHVALWHRGRRRCVILAYQGSLLFFDEDFKTGM